MTASTLSPSSSSPSPSSDVARSGGWAALPDRLLLAGVTGAIGSIERSTTWVHPLERLVSSGWSERRRREFEAGRSLLRQLMRCAEPILPGTTRAPVPPSGWRCSLAHDDELVAAVAMRDLGGSLGIDVERCGAVETALVDDILRDDDDVHDATLAFVIKEATYKAWHREGRPILGFHDVRVRAAGGAFTSVVVDAQATVIRGRYDALAGRWVAVAIGADVA